MPVTQYAQCDRFRDIFPLQVSQRLIHPEHASIDQCDLHTLRNQRILAYNNTHMTPWYFLHFHWP